MLNRITHRAIFSAFFKRWLWLSFIKGYRVIILDAPLLFESGLQRICDVTIAVSVPEATQIARVLKRDGMSEAEAKQRIGAQMTREERAARATLVVDNDGAEDALKPKAEDAVRRLHATVGWWPSTTGLLTSIVVSAAATVVLMLLR